MENSEHHPEIPQTSEEDHLLTGDELEKLWECEDAIRHGMAAFLAVAEALHTIRTQRLYREDYNNFADYCREKWNLTDRHARNLANAWDIMVTLDADPIGNPEMLPQNERQARELKQVPREQRSEVWELAVANAGGVEHVCAHDVKTARETVMGDSNDVGTWHGRDDVWAGIASQTFEPEEGDGEQQADDQRATEVRVVDRDPVGHAHRIINKYGAEYAMTLMLEVGEILRQKGAL